MSTQPQTGNLYLVVVWDFDAAPDAAEYFSQDYTDEELAESILPYYCSKRRSFSNLQQAKSFAHYEVAERAAVGAAVFKDGENLCGFGLTFPYKERYI